MTNYLPDPKVLQSTRWRDLNEQDQAYLHRCNAKDQKIYYSAMLPAKSEDLDIYWSEDVMFNPNKYPNFCYISEREYFLIFKQGEEGEIADASSEETYPVESEATSEHKSLIDQLEEADEMHFQEDGAVEQVPADGTEEPERDDVPLVILERKIYPNSNWEYMDAQLDVLCKSPATFWSDEECVRYIKENYVFLKPFGMLCPLDGSTIYRVRIEH